jgi:alanine-synthesizing transaminase
MLGRVIRSGVGWKIRNPKSEIRKSIQLDTHYNPPMAFRSRRIPRDLSLNRLAAARARMGEIPFDLTLGNPTACGIPYPPDLLQGLADPRGLRYAPDPRGPLPARMAIAVGYRQWGVEVDPNRMILTASTSEAYSFLFRLLADPGDSILVPAPSYPLFDHLARIDGVETRSFDLNLDEGWRIDFSTLDRQEEGVRAVIVVHPNNPTGSFVHPEDRDRLVALCRDRGWALIADEVFLPYRLEGGPGNGASFADIRDCLCFTLGGLSKSVGLPQLKLAWIVASGPDGDVEAALEGLEFIADAYLPVSTPVALAAPQLLTEGEASREAILARCRVNLGTLHQLAADHPSVDVLPVGGGWSAVLRVPAVIGEEELCLRLLEDCGVAVHPGSLFAFRSAGWLVTSLLPPVRPFAEGARLMFDLVTETLHANQ